MLKDKNYYVDWIYSRGNSSGRKRNLNNIKALLNELGNPQDKFKVIHIAGTNGKGSTANFIANTLSKTSRCGLFTSPFMEKINEEIKINGVAISDEDFIYYSQQIKPICEKLDKLNLINTYFDVITAIMFKYFYDKNVDVCVIETGLGGLLDSTNIVKKPIASLITTISMDHINILGNNIEEIAKNKAGIIKENVPVFIYPQKESVYKIIKKEARSKNAPIYNFSFDEVNIKSQNSSYNQFDFKNYSNVKTSLIGKVQIYNACNAINLLDYFKNDFKLNEQIIKEGIYKSENPGRLQMILENPRVLVDGCHNEESIDSMIESLKCFDYDRLIVVFSVLKDKDYKYIIEKLSSVASEILVTSIDNPRAFKSEELKSIVEDYFDNKVTAIDDNIKAFEFAKSKAKDNDLVLFCGSLYLIGQIFKYKNGLL